MPFATTWIDVEIVILSEVSQTQKDKYILLKQDHRKPVFCGY